MKYLGQILIFIALVYLGLFGIYGLGRDSEYKQVDMGYFYTAGKTWQEGKNPYHFDEFLKVRKDLGFKIQTYNFAYPPSIAPLSLFLAQFSLDGARIAMHIINGIALMLLIYAAIKLSPSLSHFQHTLLASILIANPFTAHVFWMGQTSLIAAASLAMLWLYRHNTYLLAALFGAIATIKPQLTLFPLAWLLVEKKFVLISLIATGAIIMALFAFSVGNPIDITESWVYSLQKNLSIVSQSYESRTLVFNLESFFWSFGIDASFLVYVGIALFFMLAGLKKYYNNLDTLSLLSMLSPLFLFTHDYDLVILAPVVASFMYYLREGKGMWLALALLISFYIPQRFLRDAPTLALGHIRECVLLALFFWLAHLGYWGTKSNTK